MKTTHPHADVIKAWADGAQTQYYALGEWHDMVNEPIWYRDQQYRIKPEPKPDFVVYPHVAQYRAENGYGRAMLVKDKLKLTFDGETGELKSAEVL